MFRALTVLALIFQVYSLPLFSENFKISSDKEFMQVQTFSREEVLPLLPLLHEWSAKHLLGFPYYYAPPKDNSFIRLILSMSTKKKRLLSLRNRVMK